VSGSEVVRAVAVTERPRERDGVRAAVVSAATDDDDRASAPLLADMLDVMLAVDPARRVSAGDALKMPFFARARQ
jgi:hypothetical protein